MRVDRRKLLAAVLLGLTGYLIVGCNTVEGVGKEVAAVGEGVSDIAREVNPRQ